LNLAEQTAKKSLELSDNLDSKVLLLMVRARRGEPENAMNELQSLKRDKTDDHKIYTAMGIIKSAEDVPAALAYFEKAVANDPEDFNAWFNMGLLYEDDERFEEATKAYGNAVRINPLNAQAQNNMGYAFKERRFYSYAVDHYLKAIGLRPDNPGYYYNLGNAYTHQEKIDEAYSAYKKAIELDPFFAKAHYNMGRTFLRKDMVGEAIEEFRLYLKYGDKAVFSFVKTRGDIEDEIEQLEEYLKINTQGRPKPGNMAK
jgi:tetratricopeptide (TPR) repeat protein